MPSRTDLTRESTARDTCRIFAAAYEPPPSLVGLMLYEAMALCAVGAGLAAIFTLCAVVAR